MNLLAVRLLNSKIKIIEVYGISYTPFDEQYWEVSVLLPAFPKLTVIVQCTLSKSSDIISSDSFLCRIYSYGWKISPEKYSTEQRQEAYKLLDIFRKHICDMSISSAFECVCQCETRR